MQRKRLQQRTIRRVENARTTMVTSVGPNGNTKHIHTTLLLNGHTYHHNWFKCITVNIEFIRQRMNECVQRDMSVLKTQRLHDWLMAMYGRRLCFFLSLPCCGVRMTMCKSRCFTIERNMMWLRTKEVRKWRCRARKQERRQT